jgi:hypothetical protein
MTGCQFFSPASSKKTFSCTLYGMHSDYSSLILDSRRFVKKFKRIYYCRDSSRRLARSAKKVYQRITCRICKLFSSISCDHLFFMLGYLGSHLDVIAKKPFSNWYIFRDCVTRFFSLLLEEPAWRRDSASISFFQRAANECTVKLILTVAPPSQRLGTATPGAMTTPGSQMFAQVVAQWVTVVAQSGDGRSSVGDGRSSVG